MDSLAPNTRELLLEHGIQHLSYSSMKELRNNEILFLRKYINYQMDTNIWLASIIGKSCHYGVEMFYGNPDHTDLYEKEPAVCIQKIVKYAQDYAKDHYIDQYQKPKNFWNSKTMSEYGDKDMILLVDKYKKIIEKIKTITDEKEIAKAQTEEKKIASEIVEKIKKDKESDAGLDDYINWGKDGTISKIMDGINSGLKNWFQFVYPQVKAYKFISAEYSTVTEITDLHGEIGALPVKIIIDAIYEDENGDTIIVDWKFKSQLTTDQPINPDYDMQGSTYFFGVATALSVMASKALFFEIKIAEQKPPYMQQPELRELCEANGIDWEKGPGGKWMTNAVMSEELIKIGVIELEPVVNLYVVDFVEQIHLLEMRSTWYKQTINRLLQLLVDGQTFLPNFFDGNFGGNLVAYQERMREFKEEPEAEFSEDDAMDL